VLTDTIPGIRVVKSFTNEENATDRFRDKNGEWYKTDASAATILHAFPATVGTLIGLGSILIWWVGGNDVLRGVGGMSAGLLTAFISYAGMFYGPVNFFANLNDSYQNTLASAERILDILDAEPEHDFGKGHVLPGVRGKIEFRNVNFSFDRSKNTLSDINFVIEPGEIVGIVGTTGSGKSTLINLMMRYYDGYDGEILVDDIDIRKIDMNFYRSKIGYVQQEPMMFRDTIFNNIAFGKDNATQEEVEAAAKIANAHDFIMEMEKGYQTNIGDRGGRLSGGQRQRISIARAILKNPPILILDEATSALDTESERLVQDALERLMKSRTTIAIAHRLSTIKNADEICVLHEGQIVERGTHDELIALGGYYKKLNDMQAL
jgi:ATP-binding cassette subfamily B protein/subfamily B ATP-binding cassette protein MsbA